ncbi:S-layer homology domain-containing protein [Oscillospiraceae bacterium 44-34]
MRNLKRALSLALASVMLVGMMVVGTSAASFSDVDSDHNVEAISVLQALGVMNGYDDGGFHPEANVTRNQMAMIICALLGLDGNDFTGYRPFTDVPDWAAGAVAACEANGIVGGRGEGIYDGDAYVTGVEAAAMMLRALGYTEMPASENWETPVVAKAAEVKLFKNVGAVNGSTFLNRDQVAQVSLNALKADVVKTDKEGDIIVEGIVTIPGKITYTKVETDEWDYTQADGAYADGTSGKTLQLCEKLYEDKLTFGDADDGDDDFDRPASKWTYGKTEVLVTKTPVATFVDKTSEDDVKKAIKGYDLTSVTPSNNGADGSPVTDEAGLAALTGDGKLVEVYANSDKDINSIVTVTYSVDKVKSITEKDGKTTYKLDTIAGSKFNDEDNTNVIVDGSVDEGDVVTVAVANNKWYIYPTTNFTANQTSKKTSDGTVTLTIGGDKYVVALGYSNIANADGFTNSKDDATYYVDKNGFVVKVEDLEKEAAEYAVIVKVEAVETGATLDDDAGYTVKVRAVLADGTTADYTLKTSVNGANPTTGAEGDLVCGNVVVCADSPLDSTFEATTADNLAGAVANGSRPGKLFGYTLDDGKMVLETVTAGSGSMTKDNKYSVALTDYDGGNNATVSGANALMTKNTTFVLWSIDSDGKVVVEAPITGTADLSVENAPGVAVIKASSGTSGAAEVVFLKTESVAKEEDYVYIDVSDYVVELDDDDKNIKVWNGIAADGSEVQVHLPNSTDISTLKDGLYVYNTDGKLNTTAKVTVESSAHTGAPVKGEYYMMTVDMNENLIKVGNAFVDMADAEVVSVKDDAELENNAKILVVMSTDDENKVAAIFVFEAAPEEGAPAPGGHSHSYSWIKATADDVTAAGQNPGFVADDHVQKCTSQTGTCNALYKTDGKHTAAEKTPAEATGLGCSAESHTKHVHKYEWVKAVSADNTADSDIAVDDHVLKCGQDDGTTCNAKYDKTNKHTAAEKTPDEAAALKPACNVENHTGQ